MEVLRLTTDHYTIAVTAENAAKAFHKAASRNDGIELATQYQFNGQAVSSLAIAGRSSDRLISELTNVAPEAPIHPVFFENTDYLFDVIFHQGIDAPPVFYTPLEEIKRAFISRKVGGKHVLTGAINYRNDIGKTALELRYKQNGKFFSDRLGFEVFPTKLDYKSDYQSILRDINQEFSALVFSVLKKTYQGFAEGEEANNDLVWWGVFGAQYKQILEAANLIVNKPHNRLVQEQYFEKADRLRILTPRLEEELALHRNNQQKYYRVERKTLTIDTAENQFCKYVLQKLRQKYSGIKVKLLKQVKPEFLTAEFRCELEALENQFSELLRHPFFKQIGTFHGLRQESLVLQKATGYSALFRSWLILQKGISFLDGVSNLELKNIAELYEIWCFIEMKNSIRQILGREPDQVNLAEIVIDGFNVQLSAGKESRVTFHKENGDLIELFHEIEFSNKPTDNILSHTVKQRPDIVLKISTNDLKANLQLTYLFDAKYRLDSDDRTDGKDFPPEDAINQMHRYRDAIYYQEDGITDRPKKEVIGAYVLFPGADLASETKELYFQRSIAKVNVGAYPLVPGPKKARNNQLLTGFLSQVLEIQSTSTVLQAEVIAHKGMQYEDPNGLVLIGFVGSPEQKKYYESGLAEIHHIPVHKSGGKLNSISRLNDVKYFCPVISGVSEYYEIQEVKIMPRNEIFADKPDTGLHNPQSSDPYYVFLLKNRIKLEKEIQSARGGNIIFRYARLSELFSSETISDFNKL